MFRTFIPTLALLAACTEPATFDPSNVKPSDICGDIGVGFPLTSDQFDGQAIDLDWLTEKRSVITVTAECMTIPPVRISTAEASPMPITSLSLSLASPSGADWVNQFEGDLTVASGDMSAVVTSNDLYWQLDLTDADLAVAANEELYLGFQLTTFDDPSAIDELWDSEDDQLTIMVYASHFWSEETEPGYIEYGGYGSGSLLSINVVGVDE